MLQSRQECPHGVPPSCWSRINGGRLQRCILGHRAALTQQRPGADETVTGRRWGGCGQDRPSHALHSPRLLPFLGQLGRRSLWGQLPAPWPQAVSSQARGRRSLGESRHLLGFHLSGGPRGRTDPRLSSSPDPWCPLSTCLSLCLSFSNEDSRARSGFSRLGLS